MNVVRHYVLTIRPHYDTIIAAVEVHALFREIISSELI